MNKYSIILLVVVFPFSFSYCNKDDSYSLEPPKVSSKNSALSVVPAGQGTSAAAGANKSILKMPSDELRIILVHPGGPADNAGFRAGDVLLAGDGTDINNEDDLALLLKRASRKKIFFELRSDGKLLTLPLNTADPGWLTLSGDMFKGFLLNRIQSKKKNEKPTSGPAHTLDFPSYDGDKIDLHAMAGHPVAILFWGTFQKDSYDHLRAFAKSCSRFSEKGLQCISVNTLELFTMVGKTKEYAEELGRVRREIYLKGSILVDMFMESEHFYGIEKVPSLLLLDGEGNIVKRQDGPFVRPFEDMNMALSSFFTESR